ncbi:DNA-binding protein RFX2 isoform X3 [Orcinus orca]|uniref:DNA-binding protein RFX2 isoform X3 n=1 Tax=Orcinus orca TaxID=9733 RepID=UPI0021137A37|nr:DNA-binding protein RFX2 isoform X3 [Orcinus orca]
MAFNLAGLKLCPSCKLSMQNSEGGSDSPASVALCPSSAAQAPVAQPVPASPQRVLVQAAGSAPKGAQMQPISLPRVQQVPQQVQPVQHVYPPQVQYVEGGEAVYTNGALRTAYAYNPEPQMYAPSSSASYFEAPGGAQVTVAGSSPTAVPAHSMVGITMDVGGSPIVSGTGAYLIHGGMDGTRHSLAHTSRSSPATLEMAIENLQKSEGITSHKSGLLNSHLQWLLDNYETAEGVSLPRSSLYNHYLRHCQEHKLDPVNAASFGKLIRSVFMGLRTRRLGTRGNSKYHYYGIRLKPDSPLNRLQEDTQYMAMRQQPVHQKPRYRPAQKTDSLGESGLHGSLHSTPEQAMAAQSQHHQQYIDVSHVFPEFPAPDLGSVLLQENITLHDIKALQLAYRRHCEATLDVVMNLQFHYVEKLWLSFWNSKASSGDGPASLPTSDEEPEGTVLPKDKLVSLCKCDPVLRWMRTCDHILYQALVEILIPDVLRPVPSTLTQAIRNFAKSLEGWLTNAMSDFPQQVIQTKVGVVGAFAQTLRRYTSLNHLAQAARAVLQNTAQISQMLSDLNRVDFANVQGRAREMSLSLRTDPALACPRPTGAGLMGVPVRGGRGAASGAGLQADPAAAELPGPVGQLAGQRSHPGPEAARGQPQLPEGCAAVPAEMVLLQLHGDPRPHAAQRRQLWLLPPHPAALRRVHVLPGGAPRRRGHWGDAHCRDGRVQRSCLPVADTARQSLPR